ncbi:30S ribosomal protein S11 [Candidatus Peregrinibacteria bacterium]|nr:MAG: 30S ribosomal protein S11 [Candidatus Peregrinibacteria bacterium]
MAVKTTKKKIKRTVHSGIVAITAGYNNTLVTITEENGNVLAWSSSGSSGFRGSRKSTPYAAQVAAENAVEKVRPYGLERVLVKVKGIGPGREQAIRGLHVSGLDITGIIDETPVAHNGCRRKRVRRV